MTITQFALPRLDLMCHAPDQRNLVGRKGSGWCSFLRVALVLLTLIGMTGGSALAKVRVLNPAQLGTFCPPGSELADAKHTQVLSVKEQAQIKKTVQGFMALDADYRRSGSPLGPADYWEKGYTARFDDGKDVPDDALEYIAARFNNICTEGESAISVVLLDVAEFGPGELRPFLKSRFLSSQQYWDAVNQDRVKPPSKSQSAIPDQPLVFVGLPLSRYSDNRWLIEQRKVPILVKFQRRRWLANIAAGTNSSQCKDPAKAISKQCIDVEKDKATLKQLSRPAWSIVPKDFQPASLPR